MIGLGSNRLSVCRRGGMSVTQAGRGGMEWLAGGRRPSWASPYSAQATAALKDAFTAAQWEIIMAYGWTTPYLDAINAFAPEDPYIMYSLIPTLGVRRQVVNGTRGQYFDLGIMPNTTKYEIYVGFESKGLTIFGNQNRDIMVYANSIYYGTTYMNWSSTLVNTGFHAFYGKYDGSYTFDIDGTTVTKTGSLPGGATVKAFYNTGYAGDAGTGSIEYIRLINNNTEAGWFVPFIRENNVELLNLVTGTLAERHGSFTISETPAA